MPRSPRVKTTSGTTPARVKTAVYLGPDEFQSLGAYCLKEHETQSDIIGRLIRENLSAYYVAVRGPSVKEKEKQPEAKAQPPVASQAGPAVNDDRPEDADSVSPPGPPEE